MSLRIEKGARIKVKKVQEIKEKYTVVHFFSSKKRQNSDEYDYSNWSFARLVGKAHSEGVEAGQVLSLQGADISFVAYKKDGEWVNPPNPQLVIWDFEVYNPSGKPAQKKEEIPQLPPEEDVPF